VIIVSNTTPLRYLIEIQLVDILPAMFGTIVTSPVVLDELQFPHFPEPVRTGAKDPPDWLRIEHPTLVLDDHQDIHAGEAQVIALAVQHSASRLIIDDDDAKRFVRAKGVRVVGTLAVLGIADELTLLNCPLTEAFRRLKTTQFRVSGELLDRFATGDPAVRQVIRREAVDVAREIERRGKQ